MSKQVKSQSLVKLFTDGWKPDNAQKNMEQILTANNNNVDAVLSENDGMAGGAIAALAAQGYGYSGFRSGRRPRCS